MAPPLYSDIGKQARDVLNRGYHFGVMKIDVRATTQSGMDLSSGLTVEHKSCKISGNLETRYKVKDYGLTLAERWNTDNEFMTEVSVQDQIVQGLKLFGNARFNLKDGDFTGHVGTTYRHDMVAFDAAYKWDSNQLNANATIGYQGFVGGCQATLDLEQAAFTKTNFAVGYTLSDLVLHGYFNGSGEIGGTVFHKFTPELDASLHLNYNGEDTKLEFGCKYSIDKDASVRARATNEGKLGLGYQQKLREGITVTLSSNLDVNMIAHQIGLALDLEA